MKIIFTKEKLDAIYIGKKYGRLTVLASVDRQGVLGKIKLVCRCSCGAEKTVFASALRSGLTTSCGCRKSEVIKARNFRHNKSRTAEYRSWADMKARCGAKAGTRFKNYGSRGIKVCKRWEDSFENFLKDMGEKPSNKYTLERKNNNNGYSPENCKWATKIEQVNNRRCTVFITAFGTTKTLSQWSRLKNVPIKTLSDRFKRGLKGGNLFKKAI